MCFPKQPKKEELPAYVPPARTEKQETAVKVASADTDAYVADDTKRKRKVSTALGL